MDYSNPHYLVETDWLEENLGDPDLRIIDCHVDIVPTEDGGQRFVPGSTAWAEGHIPGAQFIDFARELSDHEAPFAFMLPKSGQFTRVMQRHGVGASTRVILYDSLMSIWAARLWWMLRHFGFDNAAVLNGGLHKWKQEGRQLSAKTITIAPGTFVVRPHEPPFFTHKDEVLKAIQDERIGILDTLPPDHFSGDNSAGIPGQRAGHIPTAVNVPFFTMVDDESHTYLPAEQLSRQFARLPATAERLITYCGAGIAASSVAFALALLGKENVAVYDGSLLEWAADPDLPMTTRP